jgi:site-specific recombinase XerD
VGQKRNAQTAPKRTAKRPAFLPPVLGASSLIPSWGAKGEPPIIWRPAPPSMAMSKEEKTADMIGWVKSKRPVGTSKVYTGYGAQFDKWCLANGEVSFPASPTTVARWLRYLHEVRVLSAGTITKSAASAVADAYKFTGLPSPTADPLVKATKKVIAAHAKPRKQRLPMTRKHLAMMVVGQGAKKPDFLCFRNLFLIILMFAAMMRSAEAVALRPGDVWLDEYEGEEVLYVFIQKSKNDQERHGHTVLLGKAKNIGVCPINWFKLFLLVCDRKADALFHQKGKKKGLVPTSVNPILNRLLAAAHIQDVNVDLLTSHSARIGGASAAAAAGVNLRLIMRHGNWKSYAVFLYIRDSMADRLSVSKAIL